MKWLPLVKYLVVSDIISIIPINNRQKLNLLDHLTYGQIVKKLPKAILADVTWRGYLKQGTPVGKQMLLKKKGGMSVQKRLIMVVRSQKHFYIKYNVFRIILKINR